MKKNKKKLYALVRYSAGMIFLLAAILSGLGAMYIFYLYFKYIMALVGLTGLSVFLFFKSFDYDGEN